MLFPISCFIIMKNTAKIEMQDFAKTEILDYK